MNKQELINKTMAIGSNMWTQFKHSLKNAMNLPVDDELLAQAGMEVARITARWDVPQYAVVKGEQVPVPEDLADTEIDWILDSNGQRQTGNVMPQDFISGVSSQASPPPALPLVMLVSFFLRLAMVPGVLVAAIVNHWILPAMFLAFVAGHRYFGIPMSFGLRGKFKSFIKLCVFFGMLYLTWNAPTWIQAMVWTTIAAFYAKTVIPKERDEFSRTYKLIQRDMHFRRSGTVLTESIQMRENVKKAKFNQACVAASDGSALLDVGASTTGIFSNMGDYFAPDGNKEFKFSASDAAPGILYIGESGSGKTTSGLTPLKRSIVEAYYKQGKRMGFLELDEKGELQKESALMIEGYRFISPQDYTYFDKEGNPKVIKASILSPLAGLDGPEIAFWLSEAMTGEDTDQDVWADATLRRATMVCTILVKTVNLHKEGRLDYAYAESTNGNFEPGDLRVTLNNVFKALTDDFYVRRLAASIREADWLADSLLRRAGDYMLNEWKVMAVETRSSVLFNAGTWATRMQGNAHMELWLNASEDDEGLARIEDSLTGAWQGVYAPKDVYGEQAASVVSKLCRWRFFKALRLRGSNWKNDPTQTWAWLLWDEMALSMGKGIEEANIMPIARSLGGIICAATQTFTEIESRVGKPRMMALLGNWKNRVCYRTDPNTMEMMSEWLGFIYKRVPAVKPEDIPVGVDITGHLRAVAQSVRILPGDYDLYDQEALENEAVSVSNSRSGGAGLPGLLNAMEHPMRNANNNSTSVSQSFKYVRPQDANTRFVTGKVTLRPELLFDIKESGIHLETQFMAIVAIQRGGVKRRDICMMSPIFNAEQFMASLPIRPVNDVKFDNKQAA